MDAYTSRTIHYEAGYVDLEQKYEAEDGWWVCYGRRVDYNLDDTVKKVGEWEALSRIR